MTKSKKDYRKMSAFEVFREMCPKGDFFDYSIFLYIARYSNHTKEQKKAMLEALATFINLPEYKNKDFAGRMKMLCLNKEKKT